MGSMGSVIIKINFWGISCPQVLDFRQQGQGYFICPVGEKDFVAVQAFCLDVA